MLYSYNYFRAETWFYLIKYHTKIFNMNTDTSLKLIPSTSTVLTAMTLVCIPTNETASVQDGKDCFS